jgi:uncharacterized membrane protein
LKPLRTWSKSDIREVLFRLGVWLKGIDGALEIASGLALFFIEPNFILRVTTFLTQDELAEDPKDLIATYALRFAKDLPGSMEHFIAYYLLSHGIIKALLVWGLLKGTLWAYPISILVFLGFVAYQLYRFTFTHSLGLIALTVFDLAVIWLVWLEYRAVKRRPKQ